MGDHSERYKDMTKDELEAEAAKWREEDMSKFTDDRKHFNRAERTPLVDDLSVHKDALDIQVGGGHYKDMKIQPVEFCFHNKLNNCQSAIVKYTCRYKSKNGLEDLKKARHYIDLLIELEYGTKKREI